MATSFIDDSDTLISWDTMELAFKFAVTLFVEFLMMVRSAARLHPVTHCVFVSD
jgi:hypothetical protein